MKNRFKIVTVPCLALVLSFCPGPLLAQTSADQAAPTASQTGVQAAAPTQTTTAPAGKAQEPAEPALTVRNEKAAAISEPSANEEYTLGSGDQITLNFPGRTELSGPHTIGPDGRITLPLAGPVKVAGLTRTEAGNAITAALGTFYTDLSVTVGIEKYTSNRVRVLGYVQHPGEIYFDETPTLLDAISKAGLISPTVTKEGVTTVTGSGIPELVTIYRGNTETLQVQLRTLLMSGNQLADMRLRRNDILYVPEPEEKFVSVIGEVTKPGTIPLTPASTLVSVLAEAGCCSEGGGFNPTIQIIQPSTGKQYKVNYKQLTSLTIQKEYTLHPGDVIMVPKSGMFKVTYLLQRISPVATMVSLGALAGF